jgi:hypothetical protein
MVPDVARNGGSQSETARGQDAFRETFEAAAEQGKEGVDVYILDTIPKFTQLSEANNKWGKGSTAESRNELLAELLEGLRIIEPDRSQTKCLDLYFYPKDKNDSDFWKRERRAEIADHEYEMPDHGIFVTGIIHDLAPWANLHLIQVLNQYGVGTFRSLAWGLKQVAQIDDPKRMSVLNCSLTIASNFHSPEGKIPLWELLYSAIQEHITPPIDFLAGFQKLFENLGQHTVVGAAGNDGERGQPVPETRFPARFNSVIGVGALTHDYQHAEYSCEADNPPSDGFTAFGGDVSAANADPVYGILGIFTSPNFPDGASNDSGSARWAGTSFATPIVAGVFARLCGSNLGLTRDDVINLLRSAAARGVTGVPLKQGR